MGRAQEGTKMRHLFIVMNLTAVAISALQFALCVQMNNTTGLLLYGFLFVFNGILLKYNVEHQ